jgi:hypothetical protein
MIKLKPLLSRFCYRWPTVALFVISSSAFAAAVVVVVLRVIGVGVRIDIPTAAMSFALIGGAPLSSKR